VNQTKTFIIIPGNPPASHYYKLWCSELNTQFPNYHFETFSYPKFEEDCSQKYLDNIVSHYVEIISSKYPNQQINLIGHSIGGYFASRVLGKLQDKIDQCFLIFPFFGKAKIQGRSLLNLISFIDQNEIIRNTFVNNKNILGKFWKELTHISEQELHSSTRLAHHEKLFFKSFESPDLDEKLLSKLHLIYNSSDTWCSVVSVDKLKQSMNSTFIDSVHDFVIYPKQRENVNRLLKSLI